MHEPLLFFALIEEYGIPQVVQILHEIFGESKKLSQML